MAWNINPSAPERNPPPNQLRENAPYAPPSNVIAVIRRFRDRNLPEQIDASLLRDIGVSAGNAHRTLFALRFLKLIGDANQPTESFHTLQMSDEAEYQVILEGILRAAYQEVFKIVDPTKDPQHIVENAFRRYQPASQRNRMAILFLGLCSEAGIAIKDTPRQRKAKAEAPAPRQRQLARSQQATSKSLPDGSSYIQPLRTANINVSQLRRQYIAALIKRVESMETADATLLDRIERLMKEEERSSVEPPTDKQLALPIRTEA